MLNKGHNTTPTFMEGTSGLYQRRQSPPSIPGSAATFAKLVSSNQQQPSFKNNAPGSVFQTQYYRHQSNPGSSTQLHSVNFNNNLQQQPYIQHGAYFGQAPRPSASSTSLPMVATNMVHQQPAYIPQHTQNQQSAISPQRRLSHTPHGNNRVATRSELSSHSFSSPRQLQINNYGTAHEQQQLLQNHFLASSIPQFVPHLQYEHFPAQQQRYSVSSIPLVSVQQQLSAQNARSGSEVPRRALTSSLSIGNVVQHDQALGNFHNPNLDHPNTGHFNKYQQQRTSTHADSIRAVSAGSAQSLIAQQQHLMLRKHNSASPALIGSCELPLPPHWEMDVTPDGYKYFLDHRNKRTTWIHPLAPENLPTGWTKIYDQLHGVVYYNEVERRSQFEHPGLSLYPSTSTSSSMTAKKTHQGIPKGSQQPYSGALADRIRQSASIQSIIQHQKQQFEAQQPQQKQHQQSQPLPIYQQFSHQYYLTDIGSVNVAIEDVPDWLKLYGEAPPQSDHLLNWSLFKLSQLQQFDVMLRKLYKQEVLNVVSKYERARAEINGELLRRFQQRG